MNKLQRGFTLVESLLIILIITIIGFGGYYVWHNHHNKPISASVSPSKKSSSTKTSTTQKTPASTQQYLSIKEWGVKLPLTTNIADAYYVLKNSYVYLSLQSLANTDCSANGITLGAIVRFTANDIDPLGDRTYLSDYPSAPKIGQYYFGYTHPQAACSDDQATIAKASAAMTDFKNAVANIQAE